MRLLSQEAGMKRREFFGLVDGVAARRTPLNFFLLFFTAIRAAILVALRPPVLPSNLPLSWERRRTAPCERCHRGVCLPLFASVPDSEVKRFATAISVPM